MIINKSNTNSEIAKSLQILTYQQINFLKTYLFNSTKTHIKMKRKLQLTLLVVAFAIGINAQTPNKTTPETFQPNWYLSMYTGFNWFLGENNRPFTSPNNFSFNNNGSPLASLGLGYEFNPILGIRGQLGWARYKWTHLNNYPFTAWGVNLTGDLMVNLSNWWAGYNPNRVFDVQAFGGLGLGYRGKDVYSSSSSSLVTPIVRLGLQGNFHVTKQFDINLDLATNMVSDKMNNVTGGLFFDDFTSFQVGFTYHFKNIEAKKMAVAPAPTVQIKEVIKHDTVVVKEAPTPIIKMTTKEFTKSVFFNIGVSKITNYNQKQIIEEAADFLKTYPDAKMQIDGYADKATGTKQVNMRLSQHRAKNIANELSKTYGIDASRITAVGHGTVPQIFQTAPKNRVATLKATAEIKETTY